MRTEVAVDRLRNRVALSLFMLRKDDRVAVEHDAIEPWDDRVATLENCLVLCCYHTNHLFQLARYFPQSAKKDSLMGLMMYDSMMDRWDLNSWLRNAQRHEIDSGVIGSGLRLSVVPYGKLRTASFRRCAYSAKRYVRFAIRYAQYRLSQTKSPTLTTLNRNIMTT